MDATQGKIGLALQTALGTIPAQPTVSLLPKNFLNPMPEVTETTEDVATGNRFGELKLIQGFAAGNNQLTATATERDLKPLLEALLGPVDAATGKITVRPGNFAAMSPNQPVTVWQKHPLADVLFPNAQISEIRINIPNRNTAEIQVTINTAANQAIADIKTITFPPLAASRFIQMLHWYVKVGGKKVAPESGAIIFRQEVQAEDGAQGLDLDKRMFVIGWTANGPLTASVEFVLNESGAGIDGESLKSLVTKATPDRSTGERAKVAVETGFLIGGKQTIFSYPEATLTASNIPTGLRDKTVSFTASGVGLGVSPVEVTLPV